MTLHVADAALAEREKYAEIWQLKEYREAHSPGLENVDRFTKVLLPKPGRVIDIGCGSGKAGLELQRRGFMSSYIDITDAGLDAEVPRHRFIEAPLWSNWRVASRFNYGFCCDVLEHIPPEYSMLVCDRILHNCDTAWLQISNRYDEFGPALLGQPLHLTVQPFAWWRDRLASIGTIVDARDLCGASLFVVTR